MRTHHEYMIYTATEFEVHTWVSCSNKTHSIFYEPKHASRKCIIYIFTVWRQKLF